MAKMEARLLMVAAIGLWFVMGSVEGVSHVVGGDMGWTIPPTPTFFEDWAKQRTFRVGDELVFPFRPGSNNVYEVRSKQGLETCSTDVINMFAEAPTKIKLSAAGDYYYYSGVGLHCESGQRLHVHVV